MKFSFLALTHLVILATNNRGVWTQHTDCNAWIIVGSRQNDTQSVSLQDCCYEMMHHIHAHQDDGQANTITASYSPSFHFNMMDGSVLDCQLHKMPVMAPGLSQRFPNIISLSGNCSDGSTSVISINTEIQNSFHGFFIRNDDGDHFQVDPDDSDNPRGYIMSQAKNMSFPGIFENSIYDGRKDTNVGSMDRRNLGSVVSGRDAYKFRLAVMTTQQYSMGVVDQNRDPNLMDEEIILSSVVSVVARINGLYMREIAVFFELIDDTQKLFCDKNNSTIPSEDQDACTMQYDDAMFPEVDVFYVRNGITDEQYDIGHKFEFGSNSGFARFNSLCNDDYKTFGRTGYHGNDNEFFYLLAHEMGHQFGARHVFRDCSDESNNGAREDLHGVEPGSGTTIMSYSASLGPCENGKKVEFQPYFNSYSIEQMRSFAWYVAEETGCGEKVHTGLVEPVTQTDSYCEVPTGNFVQLTGEIINKHQIKGNLFFAWDRIDPGPRSYFDRDIPRFAPRRPKTDSTTRFLANLYVLSFGINGELTPPPTVTPANNTDDYDYDYEEWNYEIPPKQREEKMTFRFIARTAFDITNENLDVFGGTSAGLHGYSDIRLFYNTNAAYSPLKIEQTLTDTNFTGNELATVVFKGGVPNAEVEILVALVTMREVDDPDFDEVDDLVWISLKTVKSKGEQEVQETVTIPNIPDNGWPTMNLMFRSRAIGACKYTYYFDLMNSINYTYVEPPPTPTPTEEQYRETETTGSRKKSPKSSSSRSFRGSETHGNRTKN